MRIHFKVEANNTELPFDHQHWLTGTIHKWLGRNEEHGTVSLYSFSRLEGARKFRKGLMIERECSFFFSAFDKDVVSRLIKGVQADPEMFQGLKVRELVMQEEPDLSGKKLFYPASPIFIKRRNGKSVEHFLYDNPMSNECLVETLKTKMKAAGIIDDSLAIEFDKTYSRAGTKKITYNGVENKASWCPVIMQAKPETKQFAWNVGLGNSTGIGFGAIK